MQQKWFSAPLTWASEGLYRACTTNRAWCQPRSYEMVQSECDLSPVQKPRGRSGTSVCRLLRGSLAPALVGNPVSLWLCCRCAAVASAWMHRLWLHVPSWQHAGNAAHGPKARRCEAATVLLKRPCGSHSDGISCAS